MVVHVECDDEPDSFVYLGPIFSSDQTANHEDNNLHKNQKFLLDFEVIYTLLPGPESEDILHDYNNRVTRTVRQTHVFDRDWLIGGDKDQIEVNIYHILEMIQVPFYLGIVWSLTYEILNFKKLYAMSTLPKVEKINVGVDVIVWSFPDDVEDDVDVTLAVAPASEEAVEEHFEKVVVKEEGDCVICMDKIQVGSSIEAGRMPCLHMFHRTCGVDWLRTSGIFPVCRAVFPA